MNELKLRECPFCGGKTQIRYTGNGSGTMGHISNILMRSKPGFVMCLKCGIMTPRNSRVCRAIEKWNRRAGAEYLISNGVTVQEWISASEPPKKITNKVIVLCKNGYMGYGHYEDYKGERTWYNLESGKPFTDWDLEDCESYEVTHWMPLPQPPKGE